MLTCSNEVRKIIKEWGKEAKKYRVELAERARLKKRGFKFHFINRLMNKDSVRKELL